MQNRIKNPYEYSTLVEEGLFKTMNNITLVLVLFYANDQLILKEGEYDLAVSAAMELLKKTREDLNDLHDLTGEFNLNCLKHKRTFQENNKEE